MTDKPIIFSAPMVRALLESRKTMTRRVLWPQPRQTDAGEWYVATRAGFQYLSDPLLCLPYAPGDRLWVREACATRGCGPEKPDVPYPVAYAADDPEWSAIKADAREAGGWKIRSPIHMPRWASRLTLTVTEVRVQRLHDISEADAISEGLIQRPLAPEYARMRGCDWTYEGETRVGSPVSAFAALWNSLHGPDAWDANPWVWAISFTVQRGNIDQIGGAG